MESEQSESNLMLGQAIIRIIVFFDLFDYPLIPAEVLNYLDMASDLESVMNSLNSLVGENRLKEINGFYCLPEREKIVSIRLQRYNYTDQKAKIALRISRLFRFWPGVQLIALSNFIGAHNWRLDSDIDLFIITKPNRIWLTRLWCVAWAKLLNLRPNKKTKKNKICLSFYISSDHLNLEDLKIAKNDLYFNYWLADLVPIYDADSIYKKLMLNNGWLKDSLPNFVPAGSNPRRLLSVFFCPPFLNFLGNTFERLAKKMELKLLAPVLKKALNEGTGSVIVSDQVLKFYVVEKRLEFLNNYFTSLKKYEIT